MGVVVGKSLGRERPRERARLVRPASIMREHERIIGCGWGGKHKVEKVGSGRTKERYFGLSSG